MFSYNVTSLNSKIKKALNRERTNVGRSAYTDRIKSILLSASNPQVLEQLIHNMNDLGPFDMKDELKWADVGIHTIKMLNISNDYVFMSQGELMGLDASKRDIIQSSGKEIITVSDHVLNRLGGEVDEQGEAISTVSTFMEKYVSSFKYNFINEKNLTNKEKVVFNLKHTVCKYFDAGRYANRINISETIRPMINGDGTLGEYDSQKDIIIIRRDLLTSKESFLGTLIHELVHATTGLPDVNRQFEIKLTEIVGELAVKVFNENNNKSVFKKFFRRFNI